MKLKILFFLSILTLVKAFCIMNVNPDMVYYVRQMTMNTGGNYTSRFKKEKFGESYKECCNYANTDCNKAGGKDDIVTLAFQGTFRGIDNDHFFTATLPAGGYLELVRGPGDGLTEVKVYNPDGSVFNSEIQLDVKAMLLT